MVIHDSEWYGSLGTQGTVGFWTLSDGQENFTEAQWWTKWEDLTKPLVCTSSDTLTEWKADIEKLCSDSGNCTYQQKQTQARLLTFLQKVKNLKHGEL